ncbi:putative ABC transport system permease protein [Isoptericola jiangsuensis]|uniref:Putative ABC transport system permease protein n=1 Tax=Isoptericola jiangsuensis TaxID=548579 RepID=A0A2A9F117_9MICO|nr:FtsX-like permease family protein [Isoptericola jiangsuensis]PFG44703.1 putative ABC transport system permease protein [Isoptericola jiangsuensis]
MTANAPPRRLEDVIDHPHRRYPVFVALRDLRHARGRFALMAVVLVLVTFLVTFLASLTAGLARESTSAVTELPADHLAFSLPAPGDRPDFTASRVTPDQVDGWARVAGVRDASPLGVATTRATGGTTAAVTVLGVPPGSGLLPAGTADPAPGEVVLTAAAADALAAHPGDTITLGGTAMTVAAGTAPDASFSHTPVVWTSLDDWQAAGARGTPGDAPVATVVALTTDGPDPATLDAADHDLGTTTVTTSAARGAVPSFAGENTSLTTMQGFLLVISALVVGAFFSVWTVSRAGDVAVLKALGASTGYLLRDALGQAAVLLAGGVTLGTVLAAAAATVLPAAVPVVVTPATTLVPAAALVLLGLAGAAVSVARITRIDPHAALAAR